MEDNGVVVGEVLAEQPLHLLKEGEDHNLLALPDLGIYQVDNERGLGAPRLAGIDRLLDPQLGKLQIETIGNRGGDAQPHHERQHARSIECEGTAGSLGFRLAFGLVSLEVLLKQVDGGYHQLGLLLGRLDPKNLIIDLGHLQAGGFERLNYQRVGIRPAEHLRGHQLMELADTLEIRRGFLAGHIVILVVDVSDGGEVIPVLTKPVVTGAEIGEAIAAALEHPVQRPVGILGRVGHQRSRKSGHMLGA